MRKISTKDLKAYARSKGAGLVGIADLKLLEGITTYPEDLLEGFAYAVSVGVRLSDSILDSLVDRPTPLYARLYENVNTLLDGISIYVTNYIQYAGFNAVPVPASSMVDMENYMGAISHKAVARAAGMGWQGKSLLIINPEIGPRFRLATILTDMPLTPDVPLKNRCGTCEECVKACPAGAIKGIRFEDHAPSREEALDFPKCRGKVTREFKNLPFIGHSICGICVKACPWGKRASH